MPRTALFLLIAVALLPWPVGIAVWSRRYLWRRVAFYWREPMRAAQFVFQIAGWASYTLALWWVWGRVA